MSALLTFVFLLQTSQQIRSADVAFHAGYAAMTSNDLPSAQVEFAKVVRLMPGSAAGHGALGAVLLAEGNLAAAVPELEKAHRLDPKDKTATLNLANAYGTQRRYAESVALFRSLGAEMRLSAESSIAYA